MQQKSGGATHAISRKNQGFARRCRPKAERPCRITRHHKPAIQPVRNRAKGFQSGAYHRTMRAFQSVCRLCSRTSQRITIRQEQDQAMKTQIDRESNKNERKAPGQLRTRRDAVPGASLCTETQVVYFMCLWRKKQKAKIYAESASRGAGADHRGADQPRAATEAPEPTREPERYRGGSQDSRLPIRPHRGSQQGSRKNSPGSRSAEIMQLHGADQQDSHRATRADQTAGTMPGGSQISRSPLRPHRGSQQKSRSAEISQTAGAGADHREQTTGSNSPWEQIS